ncbi:hypothetical protein NST84_16655 [Paenibacillus sp. FSL R7-0345]|uniref:hypothetical protein n=1 Tax=Paenibacillus sp. FSL R7-0345 TaxID=2954535 RepID=UPI003159C5D2
MSFFKELGSLIGEVTGSVVGGTVKIAGEITGLEILEDIGDGVKRASLAAGKTMGEAASGVWDIGAGIVTSDESRIGEGFRDVGGAVSTTVTGVGNTIIHVAENSGKVISGTLDGDGERFKEGAKGLITTVAIGALAIGVTDLIVDFDGSDDGLLAQEESDSVPVTEAPQPAVTTDHQLSEAEPVILTENHHTHHVEPHWRELPNGNTIWVDGDGDSTTNSTEGWTQSNPDYRSQG